MDNVFSKSIEENDFFFKYAKGIRDIYGKEFHIYNEIFLFLGGEAEFVSEEYVQKLKPNTLIIIPKFAFHQFNVLGDEKEYKRCVINFSDFNEIQPLITETLSEIKVFPLDDLALEMFKKCIKTLDANFNNNVKIALIKAYLMVVLSELRIANTSEKKSCNEFNQYTTLAINYINGHLKEQISVTEIAKDVNVSTSYLNGVFKRDMKIPIYKYILEKKLIAAHKKIISGKSAAKVALEYGFKDYSGFYRLYKKFFGSSPKKFIKDKQHP